MPIETFDSTRGKVFYDPTFRNDDFAGVVLNHEGRISHFVFTNPNQEISDLSKLERLREKVREGVELAFFPASESLLLDPKNPTLVEFIERWLGHDPDRQQELAAATDHQATQINLDLVDKTDATIKNFTDNIDRLSDGDLFLSLPQDLLKELARYQKRMSSSIDKNTSPER